jgi:hypothetical protein
MTAKQASRKEAEWAPASTTNPASDSAVVGSAGHAHHRHTAGGEKAVGPCIRRREASIAQVSCNAVLLPPDSPRFLAMAGSAKRLAGLRRPGAQGCFWPPLGISLAPFIGFQ